MEVRGQITVHGTATVAEVGNQSDHPSPNTMNDLNKTVVVERLRVVDNRYTWVPESVSPDVRADFAIDENNLNADICKMGHLMAYYGNLHAELSAELTRKEEKLKQTFALKSASVRAQAEGGQKKITENAIREKVETDQEYIDQQTELQMTRLYANMAEGWWWTIQRKGKLIETLSYKQGKEIATREV